MKTRFVVIWLTLIPTIWVLRSGWSVLALSPSPPVSYPQSTPANPVDAAGSLDLERSNLATLLFSNQTISANVSMIHATPITSGDGAQMISGAAAGDFDNDGNVDLYVVGGGLVSDNLFINNGDGTFTDHAVSSGLAALHLGSGAAVGDFDGDGWLDIFVTSFGPPGSMGPGQHLLFRNNGDLTFTNVAASAGVNQASPNLADGLGAAFGDYDLDGDLDLFVAGWRKRAMGNRLFRNNGDGTFTDVTDSAGIEDEFLANGANGIRGFSPCFADMNGDRFPELTLAADFGTSRYYVNNRNGTFTEYTDEAGLGLEWSGMGSAIGDVNNDGLLDWYVTAIYDDENVGRGDGSKLYFNQGNHQYTEVAKTVGVDDGGWAWGTAIVDLNHDGLQDIVGTNGWDIPVYSNESAKVWLQKGDGSFEEVAAATGFDHALNGLGLLNLDYDNDGDQDIVVTAYNDEFRLYRNDLAGSGTNWLRVLLDTSDVTGLAPNGFGSRIQVVVGGQTYTRYIGGCSLYLTQSELAAHFGLGAAPLVDELIVEWADGTTTRIPDVAVNQTLTVHVYQQHLPLVTR